MSQYRKLDDAITMRFNRTTAQFRDLEREGQASGKGSVNDQACAHLWKDLVGTSRALVPFRSPLIARFSQLAAAHGDH